MVDVYYVLYGSFCCSIVRIQLSPERQPDGGVAQLGEHLPCKQGVMGSNPIISTIKERSLRDGRTEKPERKTGL